MTVFIPVGQAKWKLFFFKKNKSRRHVVRKITDVHFGRYKLHGNIQTYVVDGNGRIFSDFTGNPVVKTVVDPFSGKRSVRMLFRVFVTIKRRGIKSSVSRICADGTEQAGSCDLSSRGNCIYEKWITKEELIKSARMYGKSPYGEHLMRVAKNRLIV